MPDGQIPLGADKLVGHLLGQGIRPVIVHPERNRAVMDNPDKLHPFVARGCAVQLTAASVIGEFGDRAQKAARHMLDAGWATCVATDAHNLKGRAPRMGAARSWLTEHYGAALATRLTLVGPAGLCGVAA
jgi:protein-tyrosine phosphatase